MFERVLDVLLDALKDSAITFPVLFVCYLLIELLEEKLLHRYQSSKVLRSRVAPVISAGIGLIPQCGFSIVASDLYSKRAITIGTLFAIFIATSDEALPIMLSNPNNYLNLAIILLVKFCFAVIVGLVIDAIFTKKNKRDAQLFTSLNAVNVSHHNHHNHKHKHSNETKDECEQHISKNINLESDNNLTLELNNNLNNNLDAKSKNLEEDFTKTSKTINNKNAKISNENEEGKTSNLTEKNEDEIIVLDNENIHGCCKHKLEHENNKIKEIFIHPLKHSLTIFAYILLINIVFGLLVEFVGSDKIINFLSSTGFFEPFIATLVGLIPNCAASVLLTEVFIMGGISIGSCIAGLCVNSGLAIVMLFKMNKNVKENLLILFSLYAISTILGVIINLF